MAFWDCLDRLIARVTSREVRLQDEMQPLLIAPASRIEALLQEEIQTLFPPEQLGEITEEELKACDGSDPNKPLLMAIRGQIYDVSQSRRLYGPGGPYASCVGKDASRALAKMSFEEKDLCSDISGLEPYEYEALLDWEYMFMSKYVKVGTLKRKCWWPRDHPVASLGKMAY